MATPASPPNQRPIVIRKVKKVVGGGHHGGAWKVAYADFVTAMMAFFMLLWLLSNPDKQRLKGLAEYFSPSSASAQPGETIEGTSLASQGLAGQRQKADQARPQNAGSPASPAATTGAISASGSGTSSPVFTGSLASN